MPVKTFVSRGFPRIFEVALITFYLFIYLFIRKITPTRPLKDNCSGGHILRHIHDQHVYVRHKNCEIILLVVSFFKNKNKWENVDLMSTRFCKQSQRCLIKLLYLYMWFFFLESSSSDQTYMMQKIALDFQFPQSATFEI